MSFSTQDWDSAIVDEGQIGTFEYKGFNFLSALTTPEHLASLKNFEIRDDDVFAVTYPKSGTVFAQQVLSLICNEGHRNGTQNIENTDRVPWIEYDMKKCDHKKRPSPRLFSSHLPYYLVPKDLKCKRGKVIYIARNPKDVMTSFYHFEKILPIIEPATNLDHFMEKYLNGEVFAGSWFDHIQGWYSHKEDFNFLLITYEEMVKDLRSVVLKICQHVGKHLTDREVDIVVEQAAFKNMKSDPKANYEFMPNSIVDKEKGSFLRKGTIGDWKNLFSVAQNERFDKIFQVKMENIPIKFIWDINDE